MHAGPAGTGGASGVGLGPKTGRVNSPRASKVYAGGVTASPDRIHQLQNATRETWMQ
jgi:hypothetical protein